MKMHDIIGVRLDQESPNYGPWEKSGRRRHFVNNDKIMFTKILLIWQNVTNPETFSLRKMTGPLTVAQQLYVVL